METGGAERPASAGQCSASAGNANRWVRQRQSEAPKAPKGVRHEASARATAHSDTVWAGHAQA